jgi:hypothetical protein
MLAFYWAYDRDPSSANAESFLERAYEIAPFLSSLFRDYIFAECGRFRLQVGEEEIATEQTHFGNLVSRIHSSRDAEYYQHTQNLNGLEQAQVDWLRNIIPTTN